MGHQEGSALTTAPRDVGIAGAQGRLARAVRPTGEHWHVTNAAAGLALLVTRRDESPPPLLVLEATGGDARAVVSALAAAGLSVAVVNPRQVRDFAKATGKRAKTAARDAAALAHFAEAVQPTPHTVPREQDRALAAVLARRRQVVTMLTAEQKRLHTAVAPVLSGKVELAGRPVTTGMLKAGGIAGQAITGLPVTARQVAKHSSRVRR